MSSIIKSMLLGFLSLSFIWIVCISICNSIKLLILHIKYKEFSTNDAVVEENLPEKQATILSTPVQAKSTPQRKRRKEQAAKVYLVMQQQDDD